MKKLQLLLTSPCSENWEEMEPTAKGRYCQVCTKQVVDLTTKSDAELIAFFSKKKANVCGRLLSTQLHRELVIPPQKSNWHWLLPIVWGASVAIPSKAQELKPVIEQNDAAFPSFSGTSFHVQKGPITDTIKGKVTDEKTGKPLAGVKIKRKGFNNVLALTDSTGAFKLAATEEEKTNMLVFELSEYNRTEKVTADDMWVKMNKTPINDNAPRIMIGAFVTVSNSNNPLYVITAGKKSCTWDGALSDIKPEWIESIRVLKDASATALYGAKAANGVVLVGIKKKHAKNIKFSKKD